MAGPEQRAGKFLRISLETMFQHVEHNVALEIGSANFHGEAAKTRYDLWCNTCRESIATREIRG